MNKMNSIPLRIVSSICVLGFFLLDGCEPENTASPHNEQSVPQDTFFLPTEPIDFLPAKNTQTPTPSNTFAGGSATLPTETYTPTNTQPPPGIPSLRVVFYNGKKGVWYWRNGASRPLTDLPLQISKISDDGKLTAWISPGKEATDELVVIDMESLETRALTVEESNFQDFDWIPGTHNLLYNHFSYNAELEMLVQDLYLAEYDPPRTSVLLPWGKGGFFQSSPDGKWVYVYFGLDAAILNLQNGIFFRLTQRYEIDDFAWAPDSQSLVVAAQEKTRRQDQDPMYILKYSLDGSPPEVIATFPRDYLVDFAPDITKMLLENPTNWKLEGGAEDCQIYIADIDGTDWTCYIRNEQFATVVGWNPDSAHFLVLELPGYVLGEVGQGTLALADNLSTHSPNIRWVNSEYYLYCSEEDGLFLASLYRPSDPVFLTQTVNCLYDFAQ